MVPHLVPIGVKNSSSDLPRMSDISATKTFDILRRDIGNKSVGNREVTIGQKSLLSSQPAWCLGCVNWFRYPNFTLDAFL